MSIIPPYGNWDLSSPIRIGTSVFLSVLFYVGVGCFFKMDESSEQAVRDLREKLLSDVKKLRTLKISIIEAEVLHTLLGGKRTCAELVDHIYGLKRGDPGFNASRVRVGRALRRLEKRGYISTRVFGRDKPYGFTSYGVAVLTSVIPEMGTPRLIGVFDLLIFAVTGICGVLVFVYMKGIFFEPVWEISLLIFALFFTLVGFSLALLMINVRKVS